MQIIFRRANFAIKDEILSNEDLIFRSSYSFQKFQAADWSNWCCRDVDKNEYQELYKGSNVIEINEDTKATVWRTEKGSTGNIRFRHQNSIFLCIFNLKIGNLAIHDNGAL